MYLSSAQEAAYKTSTHTKNKNPPPSSPPPKQEGKIRWYSIFSLSKEGEVPAPTSPYLRYITDTTPPLSAPNNRAVPEGHASGAGGLLHAGIHTISCSVHTHNQLPSAYTQSDAQCIHTISCPVHTHNQLPSAYTQSVAQCIHTISCPVHTLRFLAMQFCV